MLRTRRVALVGLGGEDCAGLHAALEREGVFWRTVEREAAVPALRAMESFDAVILGLSGAAAGTSMQHTVIEMCAVPVLVVGSEEDLRGRAAALGRVTRAFAVRPCTDGEITLRLATLLRLTTDMDRPSPPTVVIADDDPVIVAVLESTLSRHGFACHIAEDGDEALLLARQFRPGVVILDVNMPKRDGFSVLREIRSDTALSGARVLMLTGRADLSDVQRGCSLGTDDYVLKPFNAAEVAARVKGLIGA